MNLLLKRFLEKITITITTITKEVQAKQFEKVDKNAKLEQAWLVKDFKRLIN
jgi:hypothetical protein